jgi:hypothetical protein
MPLVARSVEELFPLIDHCKAGNLRAVAEWISQGNPIDPPPGKKTRRLSPLQLAIEKGFLTLAETLLEAGANPNSNGCALMYAIDHKKTDIAALLIDRGMPIEADHFRWACTYGDPDMIKLLLEHGANPMDGFPIYEGLTNSLNPILGIYKAYAEKIPELKMQGDMALYHYTQEENLRGVSLLMWAGARPDKETIDPRKPDSENLNECALMVAARSGNLPILKRLKPENYPDLHADMISSCSLHDTRDAFKFLLDMGNKVQWDGPKGSEIIQHAIWRLGWATDPRPLFGTRSASKIEEAIQRIELLVQKGAKWTPDPEDGARNVRRNLRHLEPELILRVFTLFKKNNTVADSFMEEIVKTPTMQAALGTKYAKAIHQLFHPPATPNPMPQEKMPVRVAVPVIQPTLPEIRVKTEEYFSGVLRNIPLPGFWRSETRLSLQNKQFRDFLGLEKSTNLPLHEFAQAAIAKMNKKLGSFTLVLDSNEYRQTIETLKIQVKSGFEWKDVSREVSKPLANPNPRSLSQPAYDLYLWLSSSGFPGDWQKDKSLSWKAGLYGKEGEIAGYLRELGKKLGKEFCFETRGDRWSKTLEHRIWVEGTISLEGPVPVCPAPQCLNPVVTHSLEEYGKIEFDLWKNYIQSHLLQTRPTGREPLYLFWIEEKNELKRVYPKLDLNSFGVCDKLADFWEKIAIHPEITLEYDFEEDSDAWFVRLVSKSDWDSAIKALEELAKQPTLQEKYGLSPDAAKLLEWIEALDPKDYQANWTPIVEDEQEDKIGLECPWEEENFTAFLQLLVDEINQKTLYDLSLQPWQENSECKTRIRVAKKESEEMQVVRQLQFYGLQKGKLLSEDKLKALLASLIDC